MELQKNSFKGIVITVVFVAFAFYVLGIFTGGLNSKTNSQKTEIVKVDNESTWRELKSLDDYGFTLASEAMGYGAQMMEAAKRNDTHSIDFYSEQLDKITSEINILAQKRTILLSKLGY